MPVGDATLAPSIAQPALAAESSGKGALGTRVGGSLAAGAATTSAGVGIEAKAIDRGLVGKKPLVAWSESAWTMLILNSVRTDIGRAFMLTGLLCVAAMGWRRC
eukprot:364166-Chlamydomonas_euryale.AAC.10